MCYKGKEKAETDVERKEERKQQRKHDMEEVATLGRGRRDEKETAMDEAQTEQNRIQTDNGYTKILPRYRPIDGQSHR